MEYIAGVKNPWNLMSTTNGGTTMQEARHPTHEQPSAIYPLRAPKKLYLEMFFQRIAYFGGKRWRGSG
jgi:hypothetical protein